MGGPGEWSLRDLIGEPVAMPLYRRGQITFLDLYLRGMLVISGGCCRVKKIGIIVIAQRFKVFRSEFDETAGLCVVP